MTIGIPRVTAHGAADSAIVMIISLGEDLELHATQKKLRRSDPGRVSFVLLGIDASSLDSCSRRLSRIAMSVHAN